MFWKSGLRSNLSQTLHPQFGLQNQPYNLQFEPQSQINGSPSNFLFKWCEQGQWLQGWNVQRQWLDLQGQVHKIPQEVTSTTETIYCATLWKCRRYDKRELLYIEERLYLNLIELFFKIHFDQGKLLLADCITGALPGSCRLPLTSALFVLYQMFTIILNVLLECMVYVIKLLPVLIVFGI